MRLQKPAFQKLIREETSFDKTSSIFGAPLKYLFEQLYDLFIQQKVIRTFGNLASANILAENDVYCRLAQGRIASYEIFNCIPIYFLFKLHFIVDVEEYFLKGVLPIDSGVFYSWER